MKKTLFAEHKEQAEAFINELQRDYIPSIRLVIVGVNKLGIKGVTSKKYLDDLINGNFDKIRSEYWKLAQPDIDKLTGVAAREQFQAGAEERLEEFLKSIPVVFSAEIDNRSLNDPYFQQFFDIDDSGNPFIPDPAKEQIRESYREYISNPKTLKVHELQNKLAEDLQAFVGALQDAKMDKNGNLLTQTWPFITSCFEIEPVMDETELIVESIKIKPRKLNFEAYKLD